MGCSASGRPRAAPRGTWRGAERVGELRLGPQRLERRARGHANQVALDADDRHLFVLQPIGMRDRAQVFRDSLGNRIANEYLLGTQSVFEFRAIEAFLEVHGNAFSHQIDEGVALVLL